MKKEGHNRILVIGIGNIGRKDDGLGWLFLDKIKEDKELLKIIDVEYRYQLQIEDAELLCNYQQVLFIDSSIEQINKGFYMKSCDDRGTVSFTTHELSPATILHLANNLYEHKPNAFILGIQGYRFNLEHGLSEQAKANLCKAYDYFRDQTLASINSC